MTRFRDQPILAEILASANVLIEVRDARLPLLSAAWPLPVRFQKKDRVVLLNKIDRAEPAATKAWAHWLTRQGETVLCASALSPGQAITRLRRLLEERGEVRRGRGLVRAAVIGLPNVGKSTLLNTLVRAGKAPTGDRPGITVGKQWVKLAANAYLLDSPGAVPLADRIELHAPEQAFKLAICRILPEARLEAVDVARDFILFLRALPSPPALPGHYAALLDPELGPEAALELLARRLSLRITGDRPDASATARRIMVDFAAGKMGRLTLERVPVPDRPVSVSQSNESRS